MSGPRVAGVLLWVKEGDRAAEFYGQALGITPDDARLPLPDGTFLLLCPGRVPCNARGPHGLVPALEVDDIAAAKARLQRLGRPIPFEEVVPGLARLTFLDPDYNPIDFVQPLDAARWERGARISSRDEETDFQVKGLFELSVYARDVATVRRFYQERLGLETGLAYFAHIHLLFENVPLVIRPTWHTCNTRERHTPAILVFSNDGAKHIAANVVSCFPPQDAVFDGEHTWIWQVKSQT